MPNARTECNSYTEWGLAVPQVPGSMLILVVVVIGGVGTVVGVVVVVDIVAVTVVVHSLALDISP